MPAPHENAPPGGARDGWVLLGDDEPLGAAHGAPVALGLGRFLGHVADGGEDVAGVRLGPADDVLALAPHVARLRFVAIEFPRFSDGRGYSQARLLRKRLGFGGEIRAVGDVRPDQVAFMVRAGFSTFALAPSEDPAAADGTLVAEALGRYADVYQPSYPLAVAAG